MIKFKFEENFNFKSFSIEELISLHSEIIDKDTENYSRRETINNVGNSYKKRKSSTITFNKDKDKDIIASSFNNNTNREKESVLTNQKEIKDTISNPTSTKENNNQYSKKVKNSSSNFTNSQSFPPQNANNKIPTRSALLKIKYLDKLLSHVLTIGTTQNNTNNIIITNNNIVHSHAVNTQNYSSNLENSYSHQLSPVTNPKLKKTGSIITKHKSESFNHNHYSELYSYFTENSLSINLFTEIFYNMDKFFSGGDKENKYSYSVLILKSNFYRKINRNIVDKYEEIKSNKSYFFILKGSADEIKKLLNDVFVFTEGLRNHDEITLVGMVTTRKLDEFKEKYQDINLEEELGSTESNKSQLQSQQQPQLQMQHIESNQAQNYNTQSVNTPRLSLNKKKIIYQSNVTRILPEKYLNGLLVIYYSDTIKINKKQNSLSQTNSVNIVLKNILTRKNSLLNTGLINEETNPNPKNDPNAVIDNPFDFSNTLLEFIPVNNNPSKKTVKFLMKDVKALVKYRFLYQYKAINIFLYSKKRSIIIDFENELECKIFLEFMIENCPKLDKSFDDIKYHTNMWVDGLISNYDYLMYLNIQGGRSFNDLSQYPIMPWVITNYEDEENLDLQNSNNFRDLTKPIGALNNKRLMYLKDNYIELKEQGKEFPYLYGTYYSFPYIIFYYLIRTHPIYYLRFQGGNFGPTDRLFFSINNSWNSSFKNWNSQDVKELIPEFYNSDGDFLKNVHGLNFGKTQNNQLVEDVLLPKWARSGRNFINIMRSALESEYVSSNLNNWIDLVFGYKQRGEKALEADNLFHYLRYDFLPFEKPEEDRQGEIDNIFEFGQIPIQLFFNEPHPRKRSKITINEINQDSSTEESEYLKKISKLKNERMNIEKKYEKERRNKEREFEEIEMKILEREKDFNEQALIIDESIKEKESEFATYLSTLLEQNIKLKENFKNYDHNKDKVYNQWIESVKQKHNKEIEEIFKDKSNLYKSIRELETILSKNKNKEYNYNKHIEELKKSIKSKEKEDKKLMKELFHLQKIIRSLTGDQQVYLKKDENLKKNIYDKTSEILAMEKNDLNYINLKKMIRDLK